MNILRAIFKDWFGLVANDPDERPTAKIIPFPQRDVSSVRRRSV